jgi:hypothetical protein
MVGALHRAKLRPWELYTGLSIVLGSIMLAKGPWAALGVAIGLALAEGLMAVVNRLVDAVVHGSELLQSRS